MVEAEAEAPLETAPPEIARGWNFHRVASTRTRQSPATPEFHLFCLALRQPQGVADLAALRQVIAAGAQWEQVLAGTRRHRVASLLLRRLQASGSPHPPPDVIGELRRQAIEAARRSLAQTAELARLSRIFRQAGVPLLALKGVALSAQLYGDPTLRDARDVDLLVDPTDYDAAGALLVAAGYRRLGEALTPRQSAAYRRWAKEAEFAHPASGLRVELHHRWTDNARLVSVDFATLWRERGEARLAGETVATPGRRHLGLYLALHGAIHCWERLQWLVDFAAAQRQPGAIDTTLAAAEAADVTAPVLQALSLAHDWLGLRVEQRHLDRAQASRRVARLDRILARSYTPDAWHQAPPEKSLAEFLRYSVWLRLYAYSLKAGWTYRKHQVMREFVAPADWKVVRLPDRLFWLFFFIRPFGWLVRRWAGKWAGR